MQNYKGLWNEREVPRYQMGQKRKRISLRPLTFYLSFKSEQPYMSVYWMFLGPAIWVNCFAKSTIDLLGPGQNW